MTVQIEFGGKIVSSGELTFLIPLAPRTREGTTTGQSDAARTVVPMKSSMIAPGLAVSIDF